MSGLVVWHFQCNSASNNKELDVIITLLLGRSKKSEVWAKEEGPQDAKRCTRHWGK